MLKTLPLFAQSSSHSLHRQVPLLGTGAGAYFQANKVKCEMLFGTFSTNYILLSLNIGAQLLLWVCCCSCVNTKIYQCTLYVIKY